MSRVSILRTRNSKIYDHNPLESMFSYVNPFDPQSEVQNCRSIRVSSPAINHQPGYNGHSRRLALWRNKNTNDFYGIGVLDGQSLTELENHAVYKAKETTKKLNSCMKVAQGISEDSSKTLLKLHQQGEQIIQTHVSATSMDRALRKAEKILGSLGGLFSKTWKPKISREIKGPVLTGDDSFRVDHTVQRQKLAIKPTWSNRRRSCSSAPLSALEKVELEKAKQDDTLSELSNLLGKLKAMAVDMGSEIDRQNKSLDCMLDDVNELTVRVKGANLRTRYLLRT